MKTAPAVTPPRADGGYYPHIDGLRALAVLAVLAYHLEPARLPGGFVGVDVFFVISGFVVTASLAGHQDESVGAFLARFYARRLARLMPALVTMLVITTALYVLFVPKAWFNRAAETTGQAAFWGLGNWVLDQQVVNYFEPRAELNPFTHTWSLGVEEQFYLVAPLLLFVALGERFAARGQTRAIAVVTTLAIASALAWHYFGLTRGTRFVFYQLGFRFWELACGVLLFLIGSRVSVLGVNSRRFCALTSWIGMALVLLAFVLPRPTAHPWARASVAILGTTMLIGLPRMPRHDTVQQLLSGGMALWIGQRSYALYLWHWPIFVIARWTVGLATWPAQAAAVALAFVMTAVSYRWIEHPVRLSPWLRAQRAPVRIGAMLLLMASGWAAGSALLDAQQQIGLGVPTRQAAYWYPDRQLLRHALSASRQCDPRVQRSPLGGSAEGLVTYSPEGCPRQVSAQLFVLGDSHATAYQPLLEQMSAEQGRTVRVLQVPGCAFLNLLAPMRAALDAGCHRSAEASLRAVLDLAHPGDVVWLTSLRLPRLIELGGTRRSSGQDPSHVKGLQLTEFERLSIAAAALDAPRWIEPLLVAGLHVVIEKPKPVLPAHPFQCVDWFNRLNPVCAGGLAVDRAAVERYRAPVVTAIDALTAAHPGLSSWDPLPVLCGDAVCSAMTNDGRPLFFDGDHLSPYGNLLLSPHVGRIVQEFEGTRR